MGDNLCRSGLRKKLLDSSFTDLVLDVENVVANATGKTVWSMVRTDPKDPITLPSWGRRM